MSENKKDDQQKPRKPDDGMSDPVEMSMTPPWDEFGVFQSRQWLAPRQFLAHPTKGGIEIIREHAETDRKFIEERSRVHEAYIREDQKTKRLSLVIVAVCVVAACLVLVFAPDGREHVAYGVSAALTLFAAGVAGFRRLWMKTPVTELEASTAPQPPLPQKAPEKNQ